MIRLLPALVATAIVIAVASVALLTFHTGQHPAPAANPPTPHAGGSPVWLTAVERRFSVLAGRASAPPPELVHVFERSGVAAGDLRFVHRAVLRAGTVWIAPTATELCIAFEPAGVQDPLGATCSALTQATRVGVSLSVGRRAHLARPPGPGNPLLSWHAGVVPDGVRHVRIRTAAGRLASTVVRHNTYAIPGSITIPKPS